MGVILKYVIGFPKAGFKVSNDAYAGDFLLDVDAEITLPRGAPGGSFELSIYNLPEKKAAELYKRSKQPTEARVQIKLGYMDGDFAQVIDGIYTSVSASVKGDNLVTVVKGEEAGAFVLKRSKPPAEQAGKVSVASAVAAMLKDAAPEDKPAGEASALSAAVATLLGSDDGGSALDKVPKINAVDDELNDGSLRGEHLLDVLDELAENLQAEFAVVDKKVYLGRPIQNDDYTPTPLDQDRNLAVFRPFLKKLPELERGNLLEKLESRDATGFHFVIAGDPKLRPGQKVSAKVKGYSETNRFRVHSVTHSLSMSAGYVCRGIAMAICTDRNCHRQQESVGQENPDGIARLLAGRTQDDARRNPFFEVGAVKEYTPGSSGKTPHQATLFFGQKFAGTETQPSQRSPVETDDKKLLRNKPMVSPFAWHKCGLVVPVYSGMKALLGHNLGLADDALVTGFLWSEDPAIAPPPAHSGDWWLCLPVNFDPSSPPTDSTKAANDLTTNTGRRTIQVSGLSITVGQDKLGTVGRRPDEATDDEVVIETGKARVKIGADGTIEMTADVNGGVVFKIGKSGVEVSN